MVCCGIVEVWHCSTYPSNSQPISPRCSLPLRMESTDGGIYSTTRQATERASKVSGARQKGHDKLSG